MSTEEKGSPHHWINLPTENRKDDITRAAFPRQLMVYDEYSDKWLPTKDVQVLMTMDYMAVSYRQTDFPKKRKLQRNIQSACQSLRLHAYWLDYLCTGDTPEEKNANIYSIADIFRGAARTLVMIKGRDISPRSKGWLSYGNRVWTLPEALLSQKLYYKSGTRSPKKISLRKLANWAYEDNEEQMDLVDGYVGKDPLPLHEKVVLLRRAIWKRSSGPENKASVTSAVVTNPASPLTALRAEKVYALMGLLQFRIVPDAAESEEDAFTRLMLANKLQNHLFPWDSPVLSLKTSDVSTSSDGLNRESNRNMPVAPAVSLHSSSIPLPVLSSQSNNQRRVDAYYLDLAIPEPQPEGDSRIRRIYGLSILVHSRYVDPGSSVSASSIRSNDRSLHSINMPAGLAGYYSDDRAINTQEADITPSISFSVGGEDLEYSVGTTHCYSNTKDEELEAVSIKFQEIENAPTSRPNSTSGHLAINVTSSRLPIAPSTGLLPPLISTLSEATESETASTSESEHEPLLVYSADNSSESSHQVKKEQPKLSAPVSALDVDSEAHVRNGDKDQIIISLTEGMCYLLWAAGLIYTVSSFIRKVKSAP